MSEVCMNLKMNYAICPRTSVSVDIHISHQYIVRAPIVLKVLPKVLWNLIPKANTSSIPAVSASHATAMCGQAMPYWNLLMEKLQQPFAEFSTLFKKLLMQLLPRSFHGISQTDCSAEDKKYNPVAYKRRGLCISSFYSQSMLFLS